MKIIQVNNEQFTILEVEYRRLESLQLYTNAFTLRTIKQNVKNGHSEVERLVEFLSELGLGSTEQKIINSLLEQKKNKFKCTK